MSRLLRIILLLILRKIQKIPMVREVYKILNTMIEGGNYYNDGKYLHHYNTCSIGYLKDLNQVRMVFT